MNRVSMLLAAGMFLGLLAGCGSDGIVFNGLQEVEQFPVRQTPIIHYNLPSEVTDPTTGQTMVDVDAFNSINLAFTDFQELASPGHDLWLMSMYPGLPGNGGWTSCTDNPTCGTPQEVPDWLYACDAYKQPGPSWPDPTVTSSGTAAHLHVAAWTLSLQNQWFLRDVDGGDLPQPGPNSAPVTYEGTGFSSMAISIIEGSQGATAISTLVPSARQAIDTGPPQTGLNGVEQIVVPASNVVDYAFSGQGAPAGLLAAGWQEDGAKNIYIEANYSAMQGVPVPDYFGGGGTIPTGGGVFHQRFSDNWQQTTAGTNSLIDIDDGVQYAYYVGAVGNHLIGYGVGLLDSAFALPGVVNNQEDIMNLSVILDMTAFIAAGKKFQFVVEDLLRMQDTVNGDFTNPGPKSTLPGTYR